MGFALLDVLRRDKDIGEGNACCLERGSCVYPCSGGADAPQGLGQEANGGKLDAIWASGGEDGIKVLRTTRIASSTPGRRIIPGFPSVEAEVTIACSKRTASDWNKWPQRDRSVRRYGSDLTSRRTGSSIPQYFLRLSTVLTPCAAM